MNVTRIINRSVNPLLADLPPWLVKYEPVQVRAILEIVAAFGECDVVVLDAPTGSGKTLIAETVRRLMGGNAIYMCHSLGLQDQFAKDFAYAKVVKGRRNYPTGLHRRRFPFISCDDCRWTTESPYCHLCEDKKQCPYERAKNDALHADLAVLNAAYALTEWNGPGRFSGRDLVIVDECDTFENAVMGFISVEISERRMRRLGWVAPAKVTVASCWSEWLAEHIPKAEVEIESLTDEKDVKYMERLVSQMRKVQKGLADGLPYAFNGGPGRGGGVEFKPAFVGDYCKEAVWSHGKKWLLMSASVVSSGSTLRGLGWLSDYRTVTVPSTFPIANRKVHVRPVANMTKANGNGHGEILQREISREVEAEPGRVVIHTVSYSLAGDICRNLEGVGGGRRIISYRLASERSGAISEFVGTEGSILVAPSADRGVDLPDDLCRLIIIAKVPYPNLGDRMVSMRMHMGAEGQTWYTASTVRTIVQMAGRGVRHREDWCRTVILDSQFGSGVWSRGKHMFPKWFREAIVWERG